MYSYHFREWLSFFYFYCIFGWCFESTYVSFKNRHLVNRGFMKGPWLPIYGSGAILILWLTLPFQETPLLVYLTGAAGATLLEYVTGEVMVRLFRVRYWDYSNQKFQYKGHICLSSTIAWGFLSLLMVYVVHRPVERFVLGLHEDLTAVLAFLITVLMVYDFSNAFRDAMDLRAVLIQAELLRDELEERVEEKKRLMDAAVTFAKAAVEEELDETRERLEQALDEKRESLEQTLDEKIRQLEERQEQLKEHMTKSAGRLLLQNPGGKFASLKIDSAEIRERIQTVKERLKKGKV